MDPEIVRQSATMDFRTLRVPSGGENGLADCLTSMKDRLLVHKIGRLWKFKLSEVDAWVRAGGADGEDSPKGTR